MQPRIDIYCSEDTDSKFAGQNRQWAEEIIGSLAVELPTSRLSIRLFHLVDELQAFFRQEKEKLGVVSEGEAEFIATHEAWRGYPRIHICAERTKNLSESVTRWYVLPPKLPLAPPGPFRIGLNKPPRTSSAIDGYEEN